MAERAPKSLAAVLAVEERGHDYFTIQLESFDGASFGGETLGCATLAAARTCPGRVLHSLHACFLRPVPAEVPIEMYVERLSDGRRLARRRVVIRREGKLLFEQMASFAAPGGGVEFQDAVPPPEVPAPEQLPSDQQVAHEEGWDGWWLTPVEWRWTGKPWLPALGECSRYAAWVRPRLPLSTDPAVRNAAVAYLADFHSHWPVARKLRRNFEPAGYASLDQAVWLHRSLPWDDWWLLVSESDIAQAGRALCRRTLFTRDGRLVATMVQESTVPEAAKVIF